MSLHMSIAIIIYSGSLLVHIHTHGTRLHGSDLSMKGQPTLIYPVKLEMTKAIKVVTWATTPSPFFTSLSDQVWIGLCLDEAMATLLPSS